MSSKSPHPERRRGRAEGLRMAASLLRNGELLQGAADVLGQLADEEDEWATEALAGGPGAGERENEP